MESSCLTQQRENSVSAVLALETGQVLLGNSVGVTGMRVGEVVFNTALTGYQEIISDPSYSNQLITFTYPHIGNTGINPDDYQSSKIAAAGVIIKSLSKYMSNWRATISLHDFFLQQKIVAISGIDTRGLTKLLRQHGALRGCIMAGSVDTAVALQAARNFVGLNKQDLTGAVTTEKIYTINNAGLLRIVLVDFGVKSSILDSLVKLNCNITIVPAQTSSQAILDLKPDGIILSNGPGDPQACTAIIVQIKLLLNAKLPIFGICLGHQLLALALGAKTYKMPFGHHGANHPVQDVRSKQVLITSQNHGFAVSETSLGDIIEITHKSLFDNSLQGFKHVSLPFFGFQGHPEAGPGPHDALNLFKEFISVIRNQHAQKK